MGLFNQIVQFVLIISILVVLHELGHFIPAKLFKTKVEKFYLFFDVKFSLFKKKIGETVYGVGWLPLGGYVKIAGMIDESMDKEQMKQPPQPWEFRSKPAWQRLIIMVGGVTVNVLLAWFIYSAMLVVNGDTYIPMDNLEHGVMVDERGEKLGFMTGDKVISVDGRKVERFGDLMLDVILGDEVVVERDGKQITVPITDEGLKEVFTGLGNPFFFPRTEAYIGKVNDTMLAHSVGIKEGDKIVAINGEKIALWENFTERVRSTKDETLKFDIERDGKTLSKSIHVKDGSPIGVRMGIAQLEKTDEYSIGASIGEGIKRTYKVLSKQIKQFKVIFKPKTEAYKNVKGPIGIIEQMPTNWNATFFWSFTAMFSVWLAFINILPIPALDGGHVMFLLYEMITGRKPSEKVLETGQIIGFVFLVGLMAVIFGNDIWNIIKRFL